MAGDWIKMRSDLRTHPKVVLISSRCQRDIFGTIGGLHSVWCIFDAHSEDGILEGYTPENMDTIAGFPGLISAMASVGWMIIKPDKLICPRFDSHNSKSAKNRASEKEKKRKQRTCPDSVPDLSRLHRDKNGTREEKRREENKKEPPTPLPGEASTDSETENNQPLGAPSPFTLDRNQPAPFGLDHDAFDRTDWVQIEAAFVARWDATTGVIPTRQNALPHQVVRSFHDRACEPGWLVAAERALAKFPLKCLTGGMRLATFFDPETVSAILAGNYDFDPSRRPAEKHQEQDKTQEVIDSENAKFRAKNAATMARKEQQERLKVKWSAQASILTDAEIAELAEKHPELNLAKLKADADQPTAHRLKKIILQTALCKALELDRGLTPAEAELVVF